MFGGISAGMCYGRAYLEVNSVVEDVETLELDVGLIVDEEEWWWLFGEVMCKEVEVVSKVQSSRGISLS